MEKSDGKNWLENILSYFTWIRFINTRPQTCQNKPHQHFLAKVLDRWWQPAICKSDKELTETSCLKRASGIQLPSKEGAQRNQRGECHWSVRNEPRVAQMLNAKREAFREPQRQVRPRSQLWDCRLQVWGPWCFSTISIPTRERIPEFWPCPEGPAFALLPQRVCGYNGTGRLAAASIPVCKAVHLQRRELSPSAWKCICWHSKDEYLLGSTYWTSNPTLGGVRGNLGLGKSVIYFLICN